MIYKMFVFMLLLSVLSLNSYTQKHSGQPVLDLTQGWKFMNRDSLIFARPDYDDSRWQDIAVDKTWNKQGYPKYEGFAWYRLKVRIPSSLRSGAVLADSIVFHLGKIDDFDDVFLNGELIGENLRTVPAGAPANHTYKDLNYSFWDIRRRYALSVDDPRLKWDAENVLAIRVYDWGVAGGIYSGDLHIAMPDISEYMQIIVDRSQFKAAGDTLIKSVKLKNTAGGYSIKGRFYINVTSNMDGREIVGKEYPVNLAPRAAREITFRFPRPTQSTAVTYRVRLDQSQKEVSDSEGVPYILTPPAKDRPQINGALIYGQRPGKPFLYPIAASGRRPLHFSAKALPAGLTLDARSGVIKGVVHKAGRYPVAITASNALGGDTKTLIIAIGDQLALTPPMGWNSWNCWGLDVTQDRVLAVAQACVKSGLADHGWTYINVDDGWEIFGKSDRPKRSPHGEILTNKKFPNMKTLGDSIHALGLKFGLYSSPGPLTCGGYTASYGHEAQDARTFAEWGVDYLKYDLCTYRKFMKNTKDRKELIPPYRLMHQALRSLNRDIVYSICEYGFGRVWEWGRSVGGNLWRTTGDITDTWESMFRIGFNQLENARFAGPGGWNDPDMLIVGWVGWGEHLHYTNLTPDEQYTHVSLWALLSAPLLLGNDLQRLDAFTLNLLTNDEVLAVDQDALGRQAVPVVKKGELRVWKKMLSNGNLAVGVFNVGSKTQHFTLSLFELGISGKALVRDLWRQKDLGHFGQNFKTTVPAHGVTLVKLIKE